VSQSPTEEASVRESFNTQNEFDLNVRRLNTMVADGYSWSGREKNCVFLNTRDGRFATISAISGIDFPDDGRAHALVDWDHDGDLDVWSTNRLAPQVRFLRNDCESGNHFVALRLEGNGTTTNRDAIGARVELLLADDSQHSRRIKSLRAGEGFLGQSSKMLNFGLGQETEISELIVHWPAGQSESFGGVTADGFFRLVQGSGQAERWQPPQRELQLMPSKPYVADEGGPSGTVLWSRFPMPVVSYQTYGGRPKPIGQHYGQPLLINIWSPDCQPCLEELSEFTSRADELRANGLGVLALATSGMGSDSSQPVEASHALNNMGFPFESGRVTKDLLDRLQEIHDVPFTMNVAMAQPTSFLVSADGQLAAVYRGRVEVDRLLADVRMLSMNDDELLRVKGRFPGIWYELPKASSPFNMVAMILAHGRAAEADHYVETHWSLLSSEPQLPDLLARLAMLHMHNRNFDQAERRLRQAIDAAPDQGVLYTLLGVVADQQENGEFALSAFRQGVELAPETPEALTALGYALYNRKQFDAGLEYLTQAVEFGPRNVESRQRLIEVLTALGRIEESIPHRRALLRFSDATLMQHHEAINELFFAGRLPDALEELELAQERYADTPMALNDLAWFLATVPDDSLRDGARAVELATQSVQIGDGQDYRSLDTLAAALAEDGQFEKAVEIAARAAEAARMAGDPGVARDIAGRIDLYQDGQASRLPRPEAIGIAIENERFDEVLDLQREYLQFVPAPPGLHLQLAQGLLARGDPEEALAEYRRTIYRYPNNAEVINDLAWFLATAPQDELRDGEEALELAEQLNEAFDGEDYNVLDTLAAAYAENDDFRKAQQLAERAIEMAEQDSDTVAVEQISTRLASYRQGQAFRTPPPEPAIQP